MGRQSYWFVHKSIEDIKNNWINLSLWTHRIYVKVCFKAYFNFWEIFDLTLHICYNSKLILPQRASLAGVGSQITYMYG